MLRGVPCVLALSDFLFLPQRAGYSLQELFHLTRSQVSQQRALALHVLAQVIGRVSGFVLPTLTSHLSTLVLLPALFTLDHQPIHQLSVGQTGDEINPGP